MSKVVGYARGSTDEQDPAAQEAELKAAGAVRVFVDRAGFSRREDLPEWVKCMDCLTKGDTLLVRALDRVAASEAAGVRIIRMLGSKGVKLRSLTEPFVDVDPSTPAGEAIVGIMGSLTELRVKAISENTRRGLAVARTRGRVGGRPSVMTPDRVSDALRMRAMGDSIVKIAEELGVGRSSVSRAIARTHDEAVPAEGPRR